MTVQEISLDELKTALRLDGKTVTSWAEGLRNPQGLKVDRTNIYKAIKHNSPDWLMVEIESEIRDSKRRHSEYWKKRDTK